MQFAQKAPAAKKHNYYAMKQVININFQGRVVPIEVTAFDILKQYTDSLTRYFANEEGKDEIINDIENRFGELFQERLQTGATCITDDDVNNIIRSMGRPEELDAAETAGFGAADADTSARTSSEAGNFSAAGSKRLYRSENEKFIGGVCAGLANYFGIDVVIVRIIFLVAFFSFGVGIIPYIILWIAVPSTASTVIGSPRKRLFRDTDNKIIAGVCSGLANFFGVNVWIPRVLFLLPFLSFVSKFGHWGDFPNFLRLGFSPGALVIYIILWLVIPEATSTAEKLEMKGEKVDMNSIKNSVMEEMKGMQDRAKKFGAEAGSIAHEKSKLISSEIGHAAKRSSRGLGDVIALLFKIFAYFIIGCLVFAVVVGLFAMGVAAIGLFPAKDFILTDGWQNVFAWGTLIFFIAAPLIGIITWIIRKLARVKSNSKVLRSAFTAMFILGIICFVSLISSVFRDFRSNSSINQEEIALVNPAVNKLELTTLSPNKKYYRRQWLSLEPFEMLVDDTASINNVTVHLIKSPNDSFRVTMIRLANGNTRRYADTMASTINYNVQQVDSLLVMDKGIQVNKTNKFRNQRVIITVYVPVGKQVRINDNVGWGNHVEINSPWDRNWDLETDNVEQGWDRNTDYIMKEDGLYTLEGIPADEWRRDSRNNKSYNYDDGDTKIRIDENGIRIEEGNGENYRYENNRHQKALDSIREVMDKEQQRMKDSLQKVKENVDKELEKIEKKIVSASASLEDKNFILRGYNPMMLLIK